MGELMLHILDICQNSFKANASLVEIIINEDILNNVLTIEIIDNGTGMSQEVLDKVRDPFYTTRTTRKVGLGISLLELSTLQCNGSFTINSKLDKGTSLKATYQYDHIDRAPIGNIEDTIYLLCLNEQGCHIKYTHIINNKVFEFDTRPIVEILDGVSMQEYEIMLWIKDNLKQGIEHLTKEEI